MTEQDKQVEVKLPGQPVQKDIKQNQSIQQIKNIQQSIIQPTPNIPQNNNNQISQQQIPQPKKLVDDKKNLYEKYKQKNQIKICKQILLKLRQEIKKQNGKKQPIKLKKNKKYDQVVSKLTQTKNIFNWSYRQKWHQEYHQQTYNKQPNINQKKFITKVKSGLIKRGEQMLARKTQYINKMKYVQLINQKQDTLLQSNMKDKKILSGQSISQKKQKIRVHTLQQNSDNFKFAPKINKYKQSNSKISKIWKHSKLDQMAQDKQQLTNSSSDINLKSIKELFFIFS